MPHTRKTKILWKWYKDTDTGDWLTYRKILKRKDDGSIIYEKVNVQKIGDNWEVEKELELRENDSLISYNKMTNVLKFKNKKEAMKKAKELMG